MNLQKPSNPLGLLQHLGHPQTGVLRLPGSLPTGVLRLPGHNFARCAVRSFPEPFPKVLDKYLHCPLARDRPPPAQIYQRADKRQYCKVSGLKAWEMIEKARAARASLRQALLLCRDGEQMACSEFEDSRWVHKGLLMYYDRMQMPFVIGQGVLGFSKTQCSQSLEMLARLMKK